MSILTLVIHYNDKEEKRPEMEVDTPFYGGTLIGVSYYDEIALRYVAETGLHDTHDAIKTIEEMKAGA